MYVLGIDPGIANTGWAVVDSERVDHLRVYAAGVISPPNQRRVKIGKTRTGKRKKTLVPGSLGAAENCARRSGQIFDEILNAIVYYEIAAIAIEERTINTLWNAETKMGQQAVITAVMCAASLKGIPVDFLAVRDVHAVLGIKVPRGEDAKPHVKRAVGRCGIIDASINPASLRVHAYDATAVALAALSLPTSRTAWTRNEEKDARSER